MFSLALLLLGPGPQSEWARLERPEGQTAFLFHDPSRNRLVFFGENASDQNMRVWERADGHWHLRPAAAIGAPPARSAGAMAADPYSGSALLFGGVKVALVPGGWPINVYLGDTWIWNGSAWRQAMVSGPTPRVSRLVFNPVSQTYLLYGGADAASFYSDTWEWNGQAWRQLAASAVPPGRNGGALGFDPSTQRVILFGGRDAAGIYDATHAWDGLGWRQVAASGPSRRVGSACATDWVRGRLLLHSGQNQAGDTWEWDGTRWTLLDAGAGMPGRAVAAMTYDWSRARVVMGFGLGDRDCELADLWTWNGSRWNELEAAPARRDQTAMVFHEAEQAPLMFGGGLCHPSLDDTWLLRGNGWVAMPSANTPPGRFAHAMAYDAARGETVLFGGNRDVPGQPTVLGDTWVWSRGAWTQRFPIHSPGPRNGAAMTFHRARGKVVLFGGRRGYNGIDWQGDTWEWDGSDWTLVAASAPVWNPSATYDINRSRTVLFGYQFGFPGTSIEWDGTAWGASQTGPDVYGRVAGPDVYGRLVFDPPSGTTLLIGQSVATGAGEVWSWNGARWTLRGPTPLEFHGGGITYDASRRRVTLFAGAHYGRRLGETWFYRPQMLTTPDTEPRLGASAHWDINAPASAGHAFLLGLSQGRQGIPLLSDPTGVPIVWPISLDRMLQVTLGLPGLIGILDSAGRRRVTLAIPNDASLDGLTLIGSALTVATPLRVNDITPDVAVMLYR